MELIEIDNKYFLYKQVNNICFVITTANSEFGIHPNLKNYNKNINFIKKKFDLHDVFVASQIHGSTVVECDKNFSSGIEADGLITQERNYGIGVFTADCVPIFLFDSQKYIVSILHSGWKGTYNEITVNAINIFLEKYYSNINDIVIYIGPHNKVCCYEIGEELKRKFSEHYKFKQNNNIFNGNNLNLLECIKTSVLNCNIPLENINVIDYCVHCSNDVKFYSYRKDPKSLNRIFSFIFIK
ncbi:hypothetical protein SFBM_0822 [Candidatus Arthromitus sp. SFB-mouse-Japan]|uniref:peptidoglycan editing factor PgeF n=1 Tax=unclassified Candidatus Neoarthromitus TaxID=2638829 RepID=UPI00021B7D30|nr:MULTISPECIES: peptidoglycan editing factor PgeF [unclassified Candidatus Arthromitus]EIA22930.1 hypothetical protein SFB1_228G1 [Candidatus Arthromitus sp. SFB-1]EIA25043.1 hypothetical protein SFB2_041G2 [Candidatus Arthromitus sp. SFB-2]EIA27425.1 Multicopper oxidase protein [Candidatus Arthromitus sp. SFB-co]EIA27502.1 hypothetical protein SFB5_196G6 [Candidatus Arthromitus sp. SFB-5]EIA30861.1 Multicopper oxidase [Candidatus Arthromitus sp. SFB-mouse-SU]